MDDTINQRATIGGNAPPDEIEILRERLATTHLPLIGRRDELLAAEERLPEIDGDEAAGRVGDYIKLVTACAKNADAARVAAKEPFLASGRAVDGWFKAVSDPLDALKRRVERRLTAYLQAKAEAERRRAAEEAARLRREADERQRQAEEQEAAARLARTQAEADKRQAVAEATAEIAAATETQAARAEQIATAKPAELSRTRGDYGSVASLRTQWVGEIVDRAALDLEALRQHMPADGLQKAVNAFIRAGGRELRGAVIRQETIASVR